MKKLRIKHLSFGIAFFVAYFYAGNFNVNAQVVPGSVVPESVPALLSSPASGYTWLVPVLIIRYLPTADGIYLDPAKYPRYPEPWKLVDILVKIRECESRSKYCAEESTKFRGYKDPSATPSIGYQVVAIINVYEHTPPGRIGYENGVKFYYPDYSSIFSRLNVQHYVDDLGVKEVWLWQNEFNGSHPAYDPAIHKPEDFRGLQESNMSSPLTGDISNSGRFDDLPVYSHTYTVYSGNVWVANDDSFGHIRGHQMEAMFSFINQRQDGNTKLFWQDFVGRGPNFEAPLGRAGDCHQPPNTRDDYDYGNMTLVESDIEDWKPAGGLKKQVNAETWKNKPYQWPYGFFDPYSLIVQNWYVYWMQNMPGKNNLIPHSVAGEKMTNWWVFTGDWDFAIQNNIGLHEPGNVKNFLMKTGWNIVSFNLIPPNRDLKEIFKPLINDGSLVKVQNEDGDAMEDFGVFGGWLNYIGDMAPEEGYKVKVNRNCQLSILGTTSAIPFYIPLKTGWNLMGFPHTSELNANAAFQQLIDRKTLVKVQDEEGNAFEDWGVFGGWVNNLGNLKPGKGYKIKVNTIETLKFQNQPPGLPMNPNPADSSRNISLKPVLSWDCNDPEGDPVTYDVYLGTSAGSPALVSADQSTTSYVSPVNLNSGTQYFWKVIAKDSAGNSRQGPVWMFTVLIDLETFTDTRDNKIYKIAPVGNQVWLAENLAYLPSVSPPANQSVNSPFYYVYNYSGSNIAEAKTTVEYSNFGVLYNWEAAKIACPAGWHLPSDEDVKTLEKSMGMTLADADNSGGAERTTGLVGKKLKSETGWINNGNGTNSSSLSVKPAGSMYYYIPGFGSLYDRTYWWTATQTDANNAWYRNIFSGSDGLLRDSWNKSNGFSVRCVRN